MTLPSPQSRVLYASVVPLVALLLAIGAARHFPVPLTPVAPTFDAGVREGGTLRPDLCLRIGLGGDAFYECGSLRISHALPETRTLNRGRAPVLSYNSDHASAFVLVPVDVTLPAHGSVPDSVVVTLKSGGGSVLAQGRWAGSAWSPGTTRRVTLGFVSTQGTGVHPYNIDVTNRYGGADNTSSGSGHYTVVDRVASPFGTGWWLAGLERLNVGTMTVVDGGGGVRKYEPAGTDRWAAMNVDRADTLVKAGSNYVRLLPGNVRVVFNDSGQHVKTINALDHETRFFYSNKTTTYTTPLDSIVLPGGSSTPSYVFHYTALQAGTLLTSVTAPGGRSVTIGRAGTLVKSITDPGLPAVSFEYSGERIRSRTDRRGTVNTFSYAANTYRLNGAVVDSGGLNIATAITAAEGRGIGTPLHPDSAYTLLDGPLTGVNDHTRFWIDRFGSPRRIRDALQNETVLERTDSRFPALATAVVSANGRRVEAIYNSRGNLTVSTEVNPYGNAIDAATTYAYDDGQWPDFVTSIELPEGEVTTFTYDAVKGHRLTERVGPNSARTVHFRYHGSGACSGLLRAVQAPISTRPDSVSHDPTLCNLHKTITSLGFVTEHTRDAIGRDSLISTQIDTAGTLWHAQHIRYDSAGRVSDVISVGPATVYSSLDTLFTTHTYDDESNPLSLTTATDFVPVNISFLDAPITTDWTYDRAGRMLTEARDGRSRTMTYDSAGNVRSVTNGNAHVITLEYDVLGRLRKRIVPQVSHSADTCAPYSCGLRFPLYPNGPSGSLVIPADTQTYSYDVVGNQDSANNRYARVSRQYYRNGLLKSEEQRIRSYHAEDWDNHAYTLQYAYDLNGRRTALTHPFDLAATSTPQSYGYHAETGALAWVQDVLGNRFEYGYDNQGRLDSLRTKANGSGSTTILEQRTYDDDSRLSRRWAVSASVTNIYDDTYAYDARGRILHVNTTGAGRPGTSTMRYSGQGHLVRSEWQHPNLPETLLEEFKTDALGNVAWKQSGDGSEPPRDHWYSYGSGGQLESITALPYTGGTAGPDTTYNSFDAAGNVTAHGIRRYVMVNGEPAFLDRTASRSYFSADDKLAVYQKYGDASNPSRAGTYDEYRYDALGRRVMLRARTDSLCTNSYCVSAIERFVWDGSQILYELRFPGGDNLGGGGGGEEPPCDPERENCDDPLFAMSGDPLEYNTGYGDQFGQVGYTHGPGIDAPLAIIRDGGGVLVLHADWRGHYIGASPPGGSTLITGNDWPGHHRRAYLDEADLSRRLPFWRGSLVQGKRDQSGLVYKRNRYYDPSTGRFTQEDPIGLAGGLNLYGFANGDPITFTDPFGLCPPEKTGKPCGLGEGLRLFGSNFLAGFGAMPGDQDTGPGWLAGARVGVLLGGVGRVGRGVSLAARDAGSTARAIRLAEDFLGKGAKLKINDAGDAIFVSENGLRRLRFDINRPYPHQSPHGHIDEFINGEWTTRRIYPTDVPHR